MGKCRCLQAAQQRFAVLQRAVEPNSAADSENRESIGRAEKMQSAEYREQSANLC